MLSLASGTLPECTPVEVLRAAASAGFDGCGIWYDKTTWTASTTREVASAFQATDVVPLEIEVIMLGNVGERDDHRRLIDAGAEIGASEAIVVSNEPDVERTAELLADLCEFAEQRNINLCLEFLPIFAIKNLDSALAVLDRVDRRNAKLLLDPLHLARAGSTPAALADIDEDLLSFAQFCDAPAELSADADFEALYTEAVDGRVNPGAGGLPLADFVRALPPTIPLSLELRSRALREAFADPAERARNVLLATQTFLSSRVGAGI